MVLTTPSLRKMWEEELAGMRVRIKLMREDLVTKLAAANVPVVVGSMANIPESLAALGSRQDTPALLQRARAKVVLIATSAASRPRAIT